MAWYTRRLLVEAEQFNEVIDEISLVEVKDRMEDGTLEYYFHLDNDIILYIIEKGDWLVKLNDKIEVYSNKDFHQLFIEVTL